MSLARVSRIMALIIAAGWLVACATQRPERQVQTADADDPLTLILSPASGGEEVPLSRERERVRVRVPAITAADASRYVGQTGTVCGVVVSGRFATRSKGQPTFLNLDQAWPNHIFTVVIWRRDRAKFPPSPEAYYRDRRICVTGRIVEYRGRAQVILSDPAQVAVAQ